MSKLPRPQNPNPKACGCIEKVIWKLRLVEHGTFLFYTLELNSRREACSTLAYPKNLSPVNLKPATDSPAGPLTLDATPSGPTTFTGRFQPPEADSRPQKHGKRCRSAEVFGSQARLRSPEPSALKQARPGHHHLIMNNQVLSFVPSIY